MLRVDPLTALDGLRIPFRLAGDELEQLPDLAVAIDGTPPLINTPDGWRELRRPVPAREADPA